MKSTVSKLWVAVVLVLIAVNCQPKDEDGTEIQVSHQRIINQIGHLWKVDRMLVNELNTTETLANTGYIQFVPCQTSPNNIGGCDEGYYQLGQDSVISFEYSVNSTTNQVHIFVHEQAFPITGENLLGNWMIDKVTEDSLWLSDGGTRNRQLFLFGE